MKKNFQPYQEALFCIISLTNKAICPKMLNFEKFKTLSRSLLACPLTKRLINNQEDISKSDKALVLNKPSIKMCICS